MAGTEHLASAPIYSVLVWSTLGACAFFVVVACFLKGAYRRKW